ncbi:hypothetical protein VTH06DRAFT_4980 [Thermothelomyces fergusii]
MSEMNSWAGAASPNLKFEGSPESILSTADEMYPSLFGTSATAAPTVNPIDMMSAQPMPQVVPKPDLSLLASLTALTHSTLVAPPPPTTVTPQPEKKPVKKRKSWGQVLPEPKTNLPPRKRAKTEDEKEQRRVERVLRNRRAAQSSRERKRLEVEGLERRNKELEAALLQAQQINLTLLEELQKMRGGSGARTSPAFEALRPSPVVFSPQLFAPPADQSSAVGTATTSLQQILQSIPSDANKTVNPSSLSPPLQPIPEAAEEESKQPAAPAAPAADAPTAAQAGTSPDATQHPAEMLCSDLQCRSAEAPASPWQRASQQQLHPVQALLLQLQFLLASTSAMVSICQRPLTQIAISLKAGFSLPPTQAILSSIIWLVTTPHRSHSQPSSTSTNSSPTASSTARPAASSSSSSSSSSSAAPSQTRRSSTLRLRTLRKLLTCSPTLARPLMDATMAVLRLVSTEGRSEDRVSGADESAAAAVSGGLSLPQPRRGPSGWPNGAALPSREVLLTLLWVLRVEQRRLQIRQQARSAQLKPGTSSVAQTTSPANDDNNNNNNKTRFVLKVIHKRKVEEEDKKEDRPAALKRRRFP